MSQETRSSHCEVHVLTRPRRQSATKLPSKCSETSRPTTGMEFKTTLGVGADVGDTTAVYDQ